MVCISCNHGTDLHLHFSWLFLTQLIFMTTIWDHGRAGIVVYEGSNKIEEFFDIELVYTQTVRQNGIEGLLVVADPLHACVNITEPPNMNTSLNWFVLISGNSCNFETKVFNARLAGYSAAIIYTYKGRVESSSSQYGHYRFYSDMPTVVVKTEDGIKLRDHYAYSVNMLFRVAIFPNNRFSITTFLLLFSIVAGFFLVIMLALTVWILLTFSTIITFFGYLKVVRYIQESNSLPNGCLSTHHLNQLQTSTFQKGDHYETCAICLEDYKDKDKLRILPCSHGYHTKCIDPWLTNNRRICPVCKRRVSLSGESSVMGSNVETETTPLLQAQRVAAHQLVTQVPAVNVPTENLVTENMQFVSGTAQPPDGAHDRQAWP